MATVEDNVLNEDGKLKEDAVRNGVHAAEAPAPKAVRSHAMSATEAIIKKGLDAKAEATARLKALDEERAQIVDFLGIEEKPKRGRKPVLPSVLASSEPYPVPAPRAPRAKSAPKAGVKGGRKPRTTSTELENVKAAVLGALKKASEPLKLAEVVEQAGVENKIASVALKALRLEKKITSKGEARGTKYTAK